MEVPFPSVAPFQHLSAQIEEPWQYCVWGPDWWSFVDATGEQPELVHSQLHAWVDLKRQRLLVLSMRYLSEAGRKGPPDDDIQHVVLAEYHERDLADTVEQLGLDCENSRGAASAADQQEKTTDWLAGQ